MIGSLTSEKIKAHQSGYKRPRKMHISCDILIHTAIVWLQTRASRRAEQTTTPDVICHLKLVLPGLTCQIIIMSVRC